MRCLLVLEGKVVVDFGTGSWGFACVFSKLHHCKLAIGIDISAEAVKISESVSEKGEFAYGNRYKYYVSDGLSVPLPDNSVDIFFTGECIEHVENTDAFLDEIYRVLVPGGKLILTTPNPQPVLYRSFNDYYAVGPEHIALMTLNELTDYLEPRFGLDIIKGYNSSLHSSLDQSVTNVEFAKRWAAIHENCPQDACGFVVLAHKKNGWRPKKYTRSTFSSTNSALVKAGEWEEANLHQGLQGLLGKTGSQLSIDFRGSEIVILLWMHDWSGFAEVSVNGKMQTVDLFSIAGGFRRVRFKGLKDDQLHKLIIRVAGEKNQRSFSDQVIFFSASAYSRQ